MPENETLTKSLPGILRDRWGLDVSVRFLREGGAQTYLAEDGAKYLVKVIGEAFAATARQSVSILRFLEERDFPVPKTVLTRTGEALSEFSPDGRDRLIVVQEFIDGEEPDLAARAEDVGELTGRLHNLLGQYPGELVPREKPFFIGRYLEYLKRKRYPRLATYGELGGRLWERVADQPAGNCHGDLHRGNLLETKDGGIFFLDFDTVCRAPLMFDISVMCDITDYFRFKETDAALAESVYERFLSGYAKHRSMTEKERLSFSDWVAIRHFQLQATILDLYGIDCVGVKFIDAQLDWLGHWLSAAGGEV